MAKMEVLCCDNCGKQATVGVDPRWLHIEEYPMNFSNNLAYRKVMSGDYCSFLCAAMGLKAHSPNASREVTHIAVELSK